MPPFCSFAALQRSFVVATVSPFSTKQSRQTPTSSCLFSAFFSSLKTQSPISVHYPMLLIIAYQTPQNKSSACLNKNYAFLHPLARCMCRGDPWSPADSAQQRISRDSFLAKQTGTGEQCSPLQCTLSKRKKGCRIRGIPLLVEKACYRKICRDGSISALRAAAVRRLRSETRLRAQ